ncbi:hypothetical protein GQ602_005889 [Ophiocordyceps camponoti-floridani]|uniref:Uncharacterized protein n=1 Tax=Ophiocordyceps camponoti-floridani TaxID=2030778 RepID=A0A8H4VBB2_9HYPO|nr:hypothetical protein GQ602_005889 [Ophiocordyceps camponoti-floridani]
MDKSLPDVEPVEMGFKPQQDFKGAAVDVANDFGTPNLLFMYYIPFIPDDTKEDLGAIQDEFQTWNAWELGQAEAQLIGHVNKGNLPSDDSVASRITRNNFRSKAISVFRATGEAWLTVSSNFSVQRAVEAGEDDINGATLSELRKLATDSKFPDQFGVVINTLGDRIDRDSESKLFYTHVVYRYDGNSKTFRPVIKDSTFTIKMVDDNDDGDSNRVSVNISLLTYSYNFDRRFWRDHRHQGAAPIKRGEPIRAQMSFDFFDG